MKIKNGQKIYDNFTHIEGWLYDASKLALKKTGANSKNPGTEYIGGSIDIATNDELTNIVTVNFTYEVPVFSNGKENARYGVLANIVNGTYKTVLGSSKENATILKIDGRIGVNEYFTENNGKKELRSFQMNEGSFIHVISAGELNSEIEKRSTFGADFLINNVIVKEPDIDRDLPAKAEISGYIFDFRGAMMPVKFSTTHEGAIGYFESLGASNSNPIFTKVTGVQTNEIIKKMIETSSAWGTEMREVENRNRSWRITWARPEYYEFDTPETITAQEVKDGLTARKTREAELSAQFDQKNAKASAIPTGGFDF